MMDVDEEVNPGEDENSHLSIGVMSDIRDDEDADQSMNSEEQQLNENFDSIDQDQRTDNPSLSNEASEIDINITSHVSSSTILNYGDFHPENIVLNQKEDKNSTIEKSQILDIHMESSNMSLKLDDDSTHMSTDMKEGIENLSSDISMHSEQEVHSPSNKEIPEKRFDNLKDITFNTNTKATKILNNNSSNLQLCNPEVVQIKENIEMSHSVKNLSFEGAVKQQEKISTLSLKTNSSELVSDKGNTESLCTMDRETKIDNEKIPDKDFIFSTEIQLVKEQDSADMNDDSNNYNENKVQDLIKNASSQHSENKNNFEKSNLDENSLLLGNRGTEDHVIEEVNSLAKLHEKDQRCLEGSEIKTQDSPELETGQNENQKKEDINKTTLSVERDLEEIYIQEGKTINPILINNEKIDIVTSQPEAENVNFKIKPEVESHTIASDEYLKKTEIKVEENQPTSVVKSASGNDKDNLENSDSLTATQRPDDENFNFKITNFIEESKTLDTLEKETASSLTQNSDSKCSTQNKEENPENLIQGSSELAVKEEIRDSEVTHESSEHSAEDAKADAKVVSEYEDNLQLMMEEEIEDSRMSNEGMMEEEIEDSKMLNEGSKCLTEDGKAVAAGFEIEEDGKIDGKPTDNLTEKAKVIVTSDEPKESLMDEAKRDKMAFDECSVDLTEESLQPLMCEEAEKNSDILSKCSNNTNEKSEVEMDKNIKESSEIVMTEEPIVDKNIIIKCSTDILDDEIKPIIGEEIKRDKMTSDECSVDFTKKTTQLQFENGEKNMEALNKCSNNLTEDLGETKMENKTKKDLTGSEDCIDEKMDLETDKEIVGTEKLKVDTDSIIECSNNSSDGAAILLVGEEAERDEITSGESSDNFTKDSIQPLLSEEAAENSNNIIKIDDENEKYLKDSDECTNKGSDTAADEKVVKEAICSDDHINKNSEITLENEAEKEVNTICNLSEGEDISVDEIKKDSEILSKSLNDFTDKTKDIADEKVKIDSDDNLKEVVKRDVIIVDLSNESDELKIDDDNQKENKDHDIDKEKKSSDNEKNDSDSDSYIDISEYLINLNKKDYISTSDIVSDDSLSYQNAEVTEQKLKHTTLESEAGNTLSVNEEKDLENCDSHTETQERNEQVINSECDGGKTFTETADNSDTSELPSEIENHFEVIDEVCGEEEEKKKRKITTEGLAKSFPKSLFIEENGNDIDGGIFTRVVIIGDSFISQFIKMWPVNSKIKPYFIYKNKLTLGQLLRYKIQDHEFLKNSEKIFVLLICNLHEITLYSTYKYNGCRGSHAPFKYIRKVETEPRAVNHYLNAMSTLKYKLEKKDGMFVSFSYLPVIDIGFICQQLCDSSRNKNFNCNCDFSLGTAAKTESANSIININRSIFYKQLNKTKIAGIFEFCPINLTFCLDQWCIYSENLKLKENSDVLRLSYLLDQVNCLETDLKKNCSNSVTEAHLPETLYNDAPPDAYRIIVIGDTWLKYVAENWDNKLDVKPFFFCKNELTFKCIHEVVTSLTRTGVKLLLVTAIPSGEYLTAAKFSECKDHDPLEYLSPNEAILKDPLAFAEIIIKKLDLLSLNVHSNKLCKIVFLTSYPSFFKSYFKGLYEKHVKSCPSHESSKSLEDLVDCSNFDSKLEIFFKKINKHVVLLNKELGIPTCNIFSLMCKLSTNDMLVFPTEEKSSQKVQKKLLELLEKYTCNVNYNLNGENDKKKIDKQESISEAILKNSDISIKIENKIGENRSRSGSEESIFSKSERIVVLKKKEASPKNSDNVAYSGLKFKNHAQKLYTKATDDKDYLYNTESRYPKGNFSDRRDESSRTYHSPKYRREEDDRKLSPNRYEFSKYTREAHLHRKKERYARSRSRDKKYQRSRSKDRKYSRSRSRGRRYNRSRSRDRRHSRSKSRGRNKRRQISRSRSRTPNKKRFRSRSRSPYGKGHKSNERDSSKNHKSRKSRSRSRSHPNRSNNKSSRELNSVEKEAVENMWLVHCRESDLYRKHPENHPDHDRVKRMWLNIMNSQGLNTYDQSVLQCWWEYWLKKMEDLIEASWEEKKQNCLDVLSSKSKTSKNYVSSETSSSSDYESRESVKHGKKRKKSKNKSSQRKKKSKKHSPPKSKYEEGLLHSDIPTSVEEMEKLLQEFVKNNSGSKDYENTSYNVGKMAVKEVTKSKSTKENENFLDVTSILCQISDKFGALGMSLSVLHQKALECVKNDLSPYNCIDEDSKMLLELICDKIKKMLQHSDMTFVKRAIVQEAHDRLVPFLESFEKAKNPIVDIDLLAKATLGLQASEIIDFIKSDLAYKGNKNLSNEQLMDFYLKVKGYQMKILDEKQVARKNNPLEFSKPSTSRSLSSSGSFEKDVNPGYVDSVALKRLQIKNKFLALPMHEKLRKFTMFHSLQFEEKSFLLSHLDDLEKTDEDLCRSLRIMISRNMEK